MFIENYSDVLFEQATESKKSLKSVFSNCKKFSDYLVTDKILISTLNNVGIDVTKRKELIQEILKIFHLEYFTYTVWTLIDFKRTDYLSKIFRMFVKRLSDAVNRPFVTIYTAFTLSKKDRNAIVATVSKYLDKEINYEVVIKPELIGGIQVQGFGFLFDNSVATRLNEIKEGLK